MADNVGDVVIVGGGIIGCSIAYHLSELGVACTVVERCSIASAASGKAGGFLARTWCDTTPTGPLARASYDLHKKYGEMFNCDYRAVETLQVKVNESSSRKASLTAAPGWLDKNTIRGTSVMGDKSNTAQVHPAKLSQCFMEAAQKNGCKLIIDQVTGIKFTAEDNTCVKQVQLMNGASIPCDILVLAMGPWTDTASQWFRLPRIGAERAHSIVITPSEQLSAHALFIEYTDHKGISHDPELYTRPDGTVYLCGYNDKEPLPECADLVTVNQESLKGIQHIASNISSKLQDATLNTGQACYLPVPPANIPVIGKLPHYGGKVYMAAGHYCWGILNSTGTGKGLAELIVKSQSSIDLSPFDPANFL